MKLFGGTVPPPKKLFGGTIPPKGVEDPKWGRIRNKKIDLYFQNQSL